jgi:hypothetical protein
MTEAIVEEGCSFCAELAGGDPLDAVRAAGPRVEWIDSGWALLPSVGPIGSAHLLLAPRDHETFALPCDSAVGLVRVLARHFAEACSPGRVVFFEHANSATGCGVTHAHVHAVSLSSDRPLEDLFADLGLSQANSLEALSLERREIFWAMDNQGELFAQAGTRIPSQSARRAVARANGVSFETDWKKYTDEAWYRTSLLMARRIAPLLRASRGVRASRAFGFETSAAATHV